MPKQGPNEGSRNAIMAFFPIRLRACPNPTVTVVLPSPAGVGLIAVTKTNFPGFLAAIFDQILWLNLALYLP